MTNMRFFALAMIAAFSDASKHQCKLFDGTSIATTVEHGWSGKGTGRNWCNTCNCDDGSLNCTYMACSQQPDDTSNKEQQCKLSDDTTVEHGWSGKDTGGNWCNSCNCDGGLLGCTRMRCTQLPSVRRLLRGA